MSEPGGSIFQSPFERAIFSMLRPGVERLLALKHLDDLYDQVKGKTHSPDEFARVVLELLGIEYRIPEKDLKALQAIQGPLVLTANLPMGGIEALIMVRILARIRPGFKLMANKMLGSLDELKDSMLLVDPFHDPDSAQKNLQPIKQLVQYLRDGGLLGVFPAEEKSGLKLLAGNLAEPEWNENIGKLILMTGATVVPVYFHGNTSFLYRLISTAFPFLKRTLLMKEFARKREQKIHFRIGNKIGPSKIKSLKSPNEVTRYLRSKTNLLSANYLRPKPNRFRIRIEEPPKKMEALMPAIPQEHLIAEIAALPSDRVLAKQDPFEVIEVRAGEAPGLMKEIGRLRELTFREVGEGSGKACDTDRFDEYYIQLVLWDAKKQQVAGGYRIGRINEILDRKGITGLYTQSLFRMERELFRKIGPALEMGRSYVTPDYQRNFLPLMLLWTAIGQYVRRNPDYKTLLGPVSITAELKNVSQNLIVAFLEEQKMDEEKGQYVKPRNPFRMTGKVVRKYYNSFSVSDISDVQDLISEIEQTNLGVPILLKHYLKLGGKLLAFNVDPDFNNVLDGLIMVDLTQTDPHTLAKYMGEDGVKAFLEYHGKVQA